MEEIRLIQERLSRQTLKTIAQERFGDMVKAVVDVDKGLMVLGGELHSDEEAYLIERGSQQANLWGINLYPDLKMPEMVEFDSLINIRPSQGNRSRNVESESIRNRIMAIVGKLTGNNGRAS